ncbi:MAG: hypothetical protein ACLPX7_10050 [Xanthobacteraceae bacterium]
MKDIKTAQIGSNAEGPEQRSQIVALHISHSSRHVPAEERQAIRLDDEALDGELPRVTDAHTDELFPLIRS